MSTVLLRALAFIIGLLSWRQIQGVGAVLGLVWFYLVRIRRKTVLGNLALSLPEMSRQHRDIARRAYEHFGISALELLRLRHMTSSELVEKVHPRGMEHYEAARARGKGVVVVTAHFGNFDLLACSQAALGVPLAIVSRELRKSGLSSFWMETRQTHGLEILLEKGAARKILTWLHSGNVLGLTVDQRTSSERGGINIDFMGVKAWTTTAPASIALRTGAAILPVHIERRPDGDHDLIVEPEIPRSEQDGADEIQALTEQINGVVGKWVRHRPDHWMWLHRRFINTNKTKTNKTEA
ncbi:MAG: hypothetical protein GY847_34580 [Proteobacteria bacterium]|nr:hypothetical protein [Pseudomonadota bacterium]